ncbi:hypothetical protein KHS38_16990 [Mucilaginibacter sp. Bleaf8]|uniref:hypothetical protein n=1 Tax=Mucilaginibacter sp. Bleaf8 TaxID=2834430 RepID=UPI001BCDE0A2|nr:hypothetical protein [Mucilaginibacter sp. Bleaf8]MBS7566107.1 hypothetical protein [Mucilaginibacter sp. Bleaf8]
MFSLKFAARYILHRFKAINRHGLHSPFVYRMVDKVIYDYTDKKVYADIQNLNQHDKKLNRVQKLLYRLVHDYAPQHVVLVNQISATEQLIIKTAAPLAPIQAAQSPNGAKADLIILDARQHSQNLYQHFEESLTAIHENSMLLILNIHSNDAAQKAWHRIKAHPQVTVTVDLFWITLVYFRKGQVREDFLIRY